MTARTISQRVQGFTESVIREMTRVNAEYGGVNLAQGFPNFPPPKELVEAAHRAIDGDFHQYAITWGARNLREAIAAKFEHFYGRPVDPERQVTVCCGSTEAMLSTLLAVLDPGDEIVIFEPFYENYGPGAIIAGARPVYVPLEPPDFAFDPDRLARAFTPRTRAIVFNSPNNPTGKVFSLGELEIITTCWRSPTRSTSTSSSTDCVTFPSPPCPGCGSARSPSRGSPSPTR
jgi:aspartate/methionine/tyrosine aminotransferase